jgi:uncharacterized membrane protein YgaE (UPF0421/DUF939 family)
MIALPYYLVAAIAAVVTLPAQAVRSLTATRATATGCTNAALATC